MFEHWSQAAAPGPAVSPMMFIFKWFSFACLPSHTAKLSAQPAVTLLPHTFPAEAQAIILMDLGLLTPTLLCGFCTPSLAACTLTVCGTVLPTPGRYLSFRALRARGRSWGICQCKFIFTEFLSDIGMGTSSCLETRDFRTASKVAKCSGVFNWLGQNCHRASVLC